MTAEPELPLLEPSRFAQRVADRFEVSAATGSRHPLESREEVVEDGGVRFVVRVLRDRGRGAGKPGLAGKPGTAGAPLGATVAGKGVLGASPFLPPYDPALLIGAISPTHVCLLNKYNVVDRHLLIVTRALEDQESPLDSADLSAARDSLGAIDGLVFFNSGAAAGASQSHKHLQLVPFPLGPGSERFPFDRAIAAALARGLDRVPELGVRHGLVPLRGRPALEAYRGLVSDLELERAGDPGLAPYNLLMTREWMLAVPRARGAHGTIEVNALGFAGALVARGEEDLALVREIGPRQILRGVAFAR